MRRFNYAILPEHSLDTPVYRNGWRPAKSRPRPYPKPASSVGSAVILAARRRTREDARLMIPAPAFQDNYVGFHYAHVPERPLDNTIYRKSSRSVKPRPRPYPKPAASVGAAAILAARRRTRENTRPLIPAPAFQDNYVGFPPVIAGYVPQYGDDMEIDAMGPFFTPVIPGMTNGNPNPYSFGVATDNGTPPTGAPGIQIIVGYVPELPETMEVDWEGPSIPSGPSYHPAFNVPRHGDPQVMAENGYAPYLGTAGNPDIPSFPPNAGLIDPPYDPREPLFPTHLITPHSNPGLQVVEDNYTVQPPTPKTSKAPAVVAPEEYTREQLFDELFGDDGEEEEEEEEDIAPDPTWGGDGDDDLVRENDGNEDDDDEVEIII